MPLTGKNSSLGLRITWYVQFTADQTITSAMANDHDAHRERRGEQRPARALAAHPAAATAAPGAGARAGPVAPGASGARL